MLSNNPEILVVLGVFAIGALFFALGTYLVRTQTHAAPLDLRIDYVERLAIVGQPWCLDELETLRASDPDAMVRAAADAAIVVIRSRGY